MFNQPFPDFSFNDITIENVIEESNLGIVIDNKLNFKPHTVFLEISQN